NGDGDGVTGFRRQRDAGLRPVAPGLDARVDAEEQAPNHESEARIDRHPLLGRVWAKREGGQRAGEDRQSCEPEGAVARERMVSRHVTDQASRDGKPGQDCAERGYRSEQEPCCSSHTLSDRQEPRHNGGPPNVLTAETADATHELSASRELVAKVSLTAPFLVCCRPFTRTLNT